MSEYAIAADVGGTRTRTALVDDGGRIVFRHSMETLAHEGRAAVMRRLAGALEHVAAAASHDVGAHGGGAQGITPQGVGAHGGGAQGIAGVGLSLASPVEPGTGVMYNPPNLGREWDMYTPIPFLSERLSLPVFAGNDATLGAAGEHAYGAGRGCRNMVYVTVSTGIGGGVIINDRIYSGSHGFGGEIGHMTIDRQGQAYECGCGNVGCLEALASGTALARRARERLRTAGADGGAILGFAGGEIDGVDGRAIVLAAQQGDGLARALLAEVAGHLASGVINLMHIFDPEVIVIGGGLGQHLDLFMPTIEREVKRRAMAHFKGAVPVAKSELGDDVSLLGAAALVFAGGG